MSKKAINVYFKDVMRKINYYGKFDEKKIKSNIKVLYHLKEPIEQIFFVDENGDILILDEDNVPDNLNVHLYIESDPIPQNPENELDVSNSDDPNLIKFHWEFFDKSIDKEKWKNVISQNKYTYNAIESKSDNPIVVSSKSFTGGKHFIVIRKGIISYYSGLCVVSSDYEYNSSETTYNCDKYIGLKSMENDTQNIGILIDFTNKKVIFYDYYKKNVIISKDLGSESVKLTAWLKGKSHGDGNGFTILNRGCIPVPEWVK